MRVSVVVVVVALAAGVARADSAEEPVVESYRGTTLAMDGVAIGLTAVGFGDNSRFSR